MSNPNLFGATSANVRGYSLTGNIFACHFAQASPLMQAFNTAAQAGGTLCSHQLSNHGAAIGVDRNSCGGMFHSRRGGSMSATYADNLRGHLRHAFGRTAKRAATDVTAHVAPKQANMGGANLMF